jgi:hypothetical protein
MQGHLVRSSPQGADFYPRFFYLSREYVAVAVSCTGLNACMHIRVSAAVALFRLIWSYDSVVAIRT